MLRNAILALLALSCAVAAQAQTAPIVDPNATLVAELVVDAPARTGPAWWRVSKSTPAGEHVVMVFGVPNTAPDDIPFDDTLLRKRLNGAERLILPPEPKVGALSLLGFIASAKRDFVAKQPMLDSLPPPLAARFRAVVQARGESLDDYDEVKPAFAAWQLANDDAGGEGSLGIGHVAESVGELARSAAVVSKPKVVKTGGYQLLDQIKALVTLPQTAQVDCLDDSLRAIEAGGGEATSVARKWAQGQVRDVLGADRGFEACLSASPKAAAEIRRGQAAVVRAVADALQRTEYSVAVVELRPLLAQGGVLDQLRRAGFAVRAPGEG